MSGSTPSGFMTRYINGRFGLAGVKVIDGRLTIIICHQEVIDCPARLNGDSHPTKIEMAFSIDVIDEFN